MTEFRILVTGSRDWTDSNAVREAISSAYLASRCTSVVTVVHGACPSGADAMAAKAVDEIAADGWLIAEEPHPADWATYGKAAGFRRNAEMVALGADLCLAFVAPCSKPGCQWPRPHGSHGATNCADLALAAGIETKWYQP